MPESLGSGSAGSSLAPGVVSPLPPLLLQPLSVKAPVAATPLMMRRQVGLNGLRGSFGAMLSPLIRRISGSRDDVVIDFLEVRTKDGASCYRDVTLIILSRLGAVVLDAPAAMRGRRTLEIFIQRLRRDVLDPQAGERSRIQFEA